MGQENRFGEYISKLRTAKGISLEQLSDGLCDFSLLSRFERGEREPEKLLQNRFLTRLGVVPENYENFLYYKEYCRWEKRQGIIHNILDEHMEEAKRRLEEYRREYDMNYSLEQQFYLAMLAQIRRHEGCDREELAGLFELALQLTVPDIDTRSFRNRILSLEELNLLLEYRYCIPQGITLPFYEALLDYIEAMEQTMLAMAKIYPKTVYYYYLTWKNSGEPEAKMSGRMMELCDKAIELLRNANRMFYLWEMFCIKEELTPKLAEEFYEAAEYAVSANVCRGWRETLEALYREYNVSIAMYEFCYLYVESENYCIGDVIRIRRKMLGLSQEKLSEGICDSRTVSRLERHLRKPQKEIVQQLFDRLNLSTELCRTELVTDSQEAIEKYERVRIQTNNRDYRQVESLLSDIKKLVPMNNPFNMQAILKIEYLYNYIRGMLSKEDYLKKLKTILECTVPYEGIIKSGEKYLTNEEIACIQNILLEADWTFEEMHEYIGTLVGLCENSLCMTNYARMYEFIMIAVSNKMSEKGEYNYANKINKVVMESTLRNRRIKSIDNLLYETLWNNQYGKRKYKEDSMTVVNELVKCSRVSDLSKKTSNKKFYDDKIKNHQVRTNK